MTVIVDTSVWIDFLRDKACAHVDALRMVLASNRSVVTAPPILQEILQGATSREKQRTLEKQFRAVACLASADAARSCIEAARLFLECRMAGKTPRSSNDCLIACIAIEHGLTLLHNDRDFEAIVRVAPRLRIYRYSEGEA
jgi:predicted nucleic acid-binding protein